MKVLTSPGNFIKNIKFALVEASLRKNDLGSPLLADIDKYFVKNKFKGSRWLRGDFVLY